MEDKKSSGRWAPRLKWALLLAACLSLAATGACALWRPAAPPASGRPVLQWSERFAAEDYFAYNSAPEDEVVSAAPAAMLADVALPYAESRSFSGERGRLETEGIIPVLEDHPMFYCNGNYNSDGSIYSLTFSWQKRGGDYSDLSITAGYEEIEKIRDCIAIELDENGNIIETALTVTEREGVRIIAEGNENSNKTLTFQNGSGWYQIEASWNDSYAAMTPLLDWLWEHPLDFTRFPLEAGDHITSVTLAQMPEAFSGYIPDFAAHGFIEETDYLTLRNGLPYAFAGHYIAHAAEDLVKAGSYHDVEGWTIIHWCILTEPEYYELPESLGELRGLTEQAVLGRFDGSRNQSSVSFTWDGLFFKIYSNSAPELWAILETLMDN
jgi:hypothetical protein